MVVALWAGGCVSDSAPPPVDPAFAAASGLTATLVASNHIELRWTDNAAQEAGYFVEYTTSAEDDFVLLNAVPPDATLAVHPDLAPETRFIYRVVPFFGAASNIASVTTGERPASAEPPAAAPEAAPGVSGAFTLRDPATAVEARAAALQVRLLAPTRVELRWQDRSRDEDGYLVEGTGGYQDFRVFAYVPPNVQSYVVEGLPASTKCYFRVRAFYRGPPSGTAEQTTARAAS